MSLRSRFLNALLAARIHRAVGRMGKRQVLALIRLAGIIKPKWKSNIPFATQLVEDEHPFYVWAKSMRRDLDPRVFTRFVRNVIFTSMIGNGERDDYQKKRGTRPLTNLLFSVTERCNLKCRGCWAAEYNKSQDLPLGIMDRVTAELKEMHAYIVTITGGEPFLRQDIFELFKRHPDVFFQIYTNGTLIDDDVADRLLEVANAAPMLSINGFEEANDAIRGEGNFKAVTRAFSLLRKRRLLFGVSLTATARNVDSLMDPSFYDFLISEGAKIGWVFQYIPVGADPDVELMVSPEKRRELGQFVYKLRNSRPLFAVDFWNDGPAIGGCMAGGRHYVHITNTGDVEPCVFCHFAVDNIRNKSLHEVIRSPFFTDIKNRIPYDGNLLRPCMLVDRPEVFARHFHKHHPRPTHPGADTLVTTLQPQIFARAATMKPLMDRTWKEREFTGLYTFDTRWYMSLPPSHAARQPTRPRDTRLPFEPGY